MKRKLLRIGMVSKNSNASAAQRRRDDDPYGTENGIKIRDRRIRWMSAPKQISR